MNLLYSTIFVLLLQPSVTTETIDSLENQLEVLEGKERAIALNELYKLYLNNNPIKALSYTRQALTLAEKINDSSSMASSYNNMGVVYKNQGSLDRALESYIAALQIQEENKFVDAVAYTYSNIGTVYSLKGDYEKALDYFNRANDQFKSINHNLRIIGSLNNIGNVYEAMGDYDKALDFYLQSLRLYEELEDNSKAFVPFNNIGNIYFRKGDYESAMAYYQSALDLEKFNNDKNGEANAIHNMGSLYKQQQDYEKALEYFNQALEIVQETENKRLLAIIYQSLAETYFAKGDMFMAYSFLSLHTAAKDSLFNEESSKQIANLESAYQLEKKEAEIQSLKIETQLQQLQIQNDRTIIGAAILISVIGIGLMIIIYRENKIIKKNKLLLEQQKQELEEKNKIIEEKNNTVTESIDYAKSVQNSLLSFNITEEKATRSFVFHRPKDIVSGDFYWYVEKGDVDIVAVADCTGHGVAGAFMTVVGMTALEQIVSRDEIVSPADILKKLHGHVSNVLKQNNKAMADHGLDIALCKVDHSNNTITFSGANRPLFYITDGELKEIKGTKRNIGDGTDQNLEFDEHTLEFKNEDIFYMTTDGYVDQFGGPNDKKFMLNKFRKLIQGNHKKQMFEQKHIVQSEFERWKGDGDQTDDILVIGFKP